MKYFKRFLIIAFYNLLFITFVLVACNDGTIVYEIFSEKVEQAVVSHEYDSDYTVTVLLKEKYSKEFEELTEKNVGKRLNIIFNNEVLTSAIIKGKIKYGTIVLGRWKDKDKAESLIQSLTKK